ncbi:peptidyl-Lys metalloendopeptidase [Pseudomonas protegens]|uniref:M35 family metallo-endopeptidase n=1 Tax=Pseudomonas TaxID=286 RepID=UPI0021608871|nr:M35 family metallo-endopeptidase [Pseudomonas protegens]UVM09905.1 peptidase [Pseudomonas protegens]
MDTDTVVHSRRRLLARRWQSLFLLLGLGALAQSALAINVAFDGSCATQADRTAVSNAVAVATTWSTNAYNQVNNNEATFRRNQDLAYRTWFGTFSQDRYQRVRAVLDGVRFKLNSGNTLTAYCRVNPNDPCDAPGDIAATYVNARGDVQAWFCTAFFALPPRVGFDTQAGTVVHELTHSIGHTTDIPGAYGVAGSQNLGANRPSDAVENADNYEYYVEDLYD